MNTETIIPTDKAHWLELRKKDITSTEISALFGCNPYMTEFELWHRKHDNLDVAFEENERMVWGLRLQEAIAYGIGEDQGWNISEFINYIRSTAFRLGASFDYLYQPNGVRLEGILEIKNVDSLAYRDGWIVDGDNVEAPPHIELQLQQQMLLYGCDVAHIGALVGGNRVVLIRREKDPVIASQILKRAQKFWESIASNTPPAPDFHKDAEFISNLYNFSEPGKVMNADEKMAELATSYKQFGELEKVAATNKAAVKAQLLTLVGESEKVLGEGFTISLGMVGPTTVSYEREGFRNFRINWAKVKK